MIIKLSTPYFKSVVLSSALLSALAVLPHTARADEAKGRIVFQSNRDGNNEIYIMDGDGANVQRLTNNPGDDLSPCLSPDGRKIAWVSSRAGAPTALYEMNADGTSERTINFDPTATSLYPAYSPSGRQIAYSNLYRRTIYDVWTVDLADTKHQLVTYHADGALFPSWNPDGTRLAYELTSGGVPYIASRDTSDETVGSPNSADPSWGFNNRIAFYSTRDGIGDIYSMNATGQDQQRLTTGGGNREPAWSPQATKLAFSSNRDGNFEIYAINADGSVPTRLTNNSATDSMPFWGPAAQPNTNQSFSIADVAVIENQLGQVFRVKFKVTLSSPATVPSSVNYTLGDGTAKSHFDYYGLTTAAAGTVFFDVGESEKYIEVFINDDDTLEGDETFFVDISNPMGAGIVADGHAVGTIIDNEAFPTVSIGNTIVTEGNEGSSTANVIVSLSAVPLYDTSVDYATVDGSATANVDYLPVQGTLNFAPGEQQKTVQVTIKGDIRYEKDEALTIKLSKPVNTSLVAVAPSPNLTFNPQNDHWYELGKETVGWESAKTGAAGRSLYGVQGHLATITSVNENQAVNTVIGGSNTYAYIGGYRVAGSADPKAGWHWVTGEPFAYTAWSGGAPSSSLANDCTYMGPGGWGSTARSVLMDYIVEYDTIASMSLDKRPGTIVITNDDPGPLPPAEVVINAPLAGTVKALPEIKGTARDYLSGGGITKVSVGLKRESDGYYYTSVGWSPAVGTLPATLSGSPVVAWRLIGLPGPGATAPYNLSDGQYTITVYVENEDGQSAPVERKITVDATPPTVSVTTPANGFVVLK